MLEIIREKLADFIAPGLAERRNRLERAADTCAITELPNFAAFKRAESGARRDGLAFIIFDLNNFGLVNKKYSHERGDEILKCYADVIANVARKFGARAFHLHGDEFALICRRRFADKIRDAVEIRALPVSFDGFEVSISGTVGDTLAVADALLQARKAKRKEELQRLCGL